MSVSTDRSRYVSNASNTLRGLRLPWILGILAGLSLGAIAGRLLPNNEETLADGQILETFPMDSGASTINMMHSVAHTQRQDNEIRSYDTGNAGLTKELFSPQSSPVGNGLTSTPTGDKNTIVRTAEVNSTEPASIPRTIQSPDWASPIPRGLRAVADVSNPHLESMLHDELPFADASERQVWQDVLNGMPLNDAREIVRMRTRLSTRPLIGPGAIASVPKASVPKPLKTSRPKTFEGSLLALEDAEQIIRHNIANATALGFLPGMPLMVEAVDQPGTRCAGEMILSDRWTTLSTGRKADILPPMDSFIGVAVGGQSGSKQAQSDDSTPNTNAEKSEIPKNTTEQSPISLTKFGRLTVSEGYLAVDFADGPQRVIPEIAVDLGKTLFDAVAEIQLWTVEDPGYLSRRGGGRFEPTSRSGKPIHCETAPEFESLAIGDVDVDAATRQLELLQARRILLQHTQTTTSAQSGR